MNKSVWLKNEVFNWYVESRGGSSINHNDRVRAYELWARANELIVENADDFHRSDSISNLKRCLNQRLKFIEYVYGLRQVASAKGCLECLETFEIVRPFMLKNLMVIRNDIEHNDTPPPDIERCQELVDLVWYFLKSTDSFLIWRKDDIFFTNLTEKGEKTQYGFGMKIDYDLNHEMQMIGWFPENYISEKPELDSSEVEIEIMHSKKEKWTNDSYHDDKLDSDVWLIGNALLDAPLKQKAIKEALQARE